MVDGAREPRRPPLFSGGRRLAHRARVAPRAVVSLQMEAGDDVGGTAAICAAVLPYLQLLADIDLTELEAVAFSN